MTLVIQQATNDKINQAADCLQSGAVVAFPTETVYGLGGDATNSDAVLKIYKIKSRPEFNPLIVHISEPHDIYKFCEVSDHAERLMAAFWPGPLSLVLPLADNPKITISDVVTAGLQTVAVRCPEHRTARDLISKAGVPLAAPSANISGNISPTTSAHVMSAFEGEPEQPDMILSDGAATKGLESTIVDVSGHAPRILRYGHILKEHIEEVLSCSVLTPEGEENIKSPGQLKRHYATETPLRLNAVDVKSGEALLAFGSLSFMASEDYKGAKDMPEHLVCNLSAQGDLTEAARSLFKAMHQLDQLDVPSIAVMPIPMDGLGYAINDRLQRAATPKEKDM